MERKVPDNHSVLREKRRGVMVSLHNVGPMTCPRCHNAELVEDTVEILIHQQFAIGVFIEMRASGIRALVCSNCAFALLPGIVEKDKFKAFMFEAELAE